MLSNCIASKLLKSILIPYLPNTHPVKRCVSSCMPLPTAYSHASSELWVHLHIHSCKYMLVQLVQPHTNLRASSASSCLTSPSLRYRRVLTLWPSRLSLAVEGSKYSGHSCTWTLLLYHCILILQFSYQIIVFCSYSLSQFKFKLTKLKNFLKLLHLKKSQIIAMFSLAMELTNL